MKTTGDDKRFSGITLIAVTADTDVRNNFETSYFDDIILKPVSPDKIRSVLEQLDAAGFMPRKISETAKTPPAAATGTETV